MTARGIRRRMQKAAKNGNGKVVGDIMANAGAQNITLQNPVSEHFGPFVDMPSWPNVAP